jgi:hypothetical protein
MRNEAGFAGAKQLRKVAKMWYRADHATANAGCALVAGYPAGLLKARGVSLGAISSGTVRGGDLVVAWANDWGYLLEPGEDLRADRARAVLLVPGGQLPLHPRVRAGHPRRVVRPADVPNRQRPPGGLKRGAPAPSRTASRTVPTEGEP